MAEVLEPDLRHFATSTRTSAAIEDNIVGLLTRHKSREFRRYQHLREKLKRKTVDLIAGVLNEAGKVEKKAPASRWPKETETEKAK